MSPLTWPVVDAMLADLRAWGVGRTSLLVIPDHHGRGRFRDDPALCRALERLAVKEGHELVVHGYFHRRAPRASEGVVTRWVTGTYTAGEGEFYDLEEAAATERLERAREDFATLDAPAPVGFIAPAWLLGDAAERAVRAAGFRYTTRLGTVTDYATGDVTRSQSLVWSPRNAWRRAVRPRLERRAGPPAARARAAARRRPPAGPVAPGAVAPGGTAGAGGVAGRPRTGDVCGLRGRIPLGRTTSVSSLSRDDTTESAR